MERGSKVYAKVQKKLESKTLSRLVRENIDIDASIIITDEFTNYIRLRGFANHQVETFDLIS